MKWQIFFVFFILGSILLAQGKSKTSFPPVMQEKIEATKASLATLEKFARNAKPAPATNVSEAVRRETRRLSRDVSNALGAVVAADVKGRIDGSLTAQEERCVYRWAKSIERRRVRAEGFFASRVERERIVIHIGAYQ
jgi:hypothetical protein